MIIINNTVQTILSCKQSFAFIVSAYRMPRKKDREHFLCVCVYEYKCATA